MSSEALYSVAAVVKLTGLSPNTLRTWERRHGAVRPRRDESGHRVYTTEDVERLRLLKELSANGEPVRRFAGAALGVLQTRATTHRDANRGAHTIEQRRGPPPRVAIVHNSLLEVFAVTSRAVPWEVVFQADELPTFLAQFPRREAPVEVLLVDLGRLGGSPVEAMAQARERCGAAHVVVTYDFASSALRGSLRSAGARLVRGPLEPQRVLAEVSDVNDGEGAGARAAPPPPPRRYEERDLARLRTIATALECECPRHLATLVTQLAAFEDYSASCARLSAADAAMHDQLTVGVAHARAALEDSLSALCAYEGIVLESRPPDARAQTAKAPPAPPRRGRTRVIPKDGNRGRPRP